jgi:hypothetical protein
MNTHNSSSTAARTVQTADLYIARDGGKPMRERTEEENNAQDGADILTIASFLAWCPEDEMYSMVTAGEAFKAFARLLDMPHVTLRSAIQRE